MAPSDAEWVFALLDAVREYPVIYNKGQQSYRIRLVKEKAWMEVVKKVYETSGVEKTGKYDPS